MCLELPPNPGITPRDNSGKPSWTLGTAIRAWLACINTNDVMQEVQKMGGDEKMLNMKHKPKPFLTLHPKQVLQWQQQLASWHLHLWQNTTE